MSEKNYNLDIPSKFQDVFENFFTTDSDIENNCVDKIIDESYWYELVLVNDSNEMIPKNLQLWTERTRLAILCIYGSFHEESQIHINHPIFDLIIKSIFSSFDIVFKDDEKYSKWKEFYFLFRDDKIDSNHEELRSLTRYMFDKSYQCSDHILSFWDFMILYVNMFPIEIYHMCDLSDDIEIIPDIIEQLSFQRKYRDSVLFLSDPANIKLKCYRHYIYHPGDVLEYAKVHLYCALALLKVNQFSR